MIPEVDTMDVVQEAGPSPDVTVFRLKGPFVLGTMFAFQAALREPAVKGVIIDLSEVPYIDSAGLGVLLGHWSHTQRGGHKFALAGMSPRHLCDSGRSGSQLREVGLTAGQLLAIAKLSRAAAAVRARSSRVCAVETNNASNCDGGR